MTIVKMVINPKLLVKIEKDLLERIDQTKLGLIDVDTNLEHIEYLVGKFPADEALGQIESRVQAKKRRLLNDLNEMLVPAKTKRKVKRKYTRQAQLSSKAPTKKAVKKRSPKKARKNAVKKS